MSFCRFAWNGSDVYVFESDRGIECCGCRFQDAFVTDDPEVMIAHLAKHRRAGHFVPEHAITSLWAVIPGAQRPAKREPPSLTHARLFGALCQLQHAVDEAQARVEAADAAEAAKDSRKQAVAKGGRSRLRPQQTKVRNAGKPKT